MSKGGRREGAGRPLSGLSKLDKQVKIMFEGADHASLLMLARKQGKTISTIIRKWVVEGLRREDRKK